MDSLLSAIWCCCNSPTDASTPVDDPSLGQGHDEVSNGGIPLEVEGTASLSERIKWPGGTGNHDVFAVGAPAAEDFPSSGSSYLVQKSDVSEVSEAYVEPSRQNVSHATDIRGSKILLVGKKSHLDVKNADEGAADFSSMLSMESNYSLPASTLPRPKNFKRRMEALAAGHEDGILRDWRDMTDETDVPEYVIKCRDDNEIKSYQFMQDSTDPLMHFIPTFFGDVDPTELDGEGLEKRFIRLSNLLRPFKQAHVMDCKVGIRSFQEDEVKKTKLRADLYERMCKLDPSAPTASEREAGACTKYRWMTFNDHLTRLSQNGFRIDGIVASNAVPGPELKGELKKLQSLSDMARCIIKYFLPTLGDAEGGDADGRAELQLRRAVAEAMVRRLEEMRHAMDLSPFVASHSLVGSSILFIVEANGPLATAYLIDFAKTSALPQGLAVDHKSPWRPGNHEDGLFTGVENLSKCWQIVLQLLSTPQ